MRNVLGIPAPKVYDWSAKSETNGVGAEYIFMEKVEGIQLEEVWKDLSLNEKFEIVKKVMSYQRKWASASFRQYGSLYYSKDLDMNSQHDYLYVDNEGNKVCDSKFAIGPSNGREFWDHGRSEAEFDRGPCTRHYIPPLSKLGDLLMRKT